MNAVHSLPTILLAFRPPSAFRVFPGTKPSLIRPADPHGKILHCASTIPKGIFPSAPAGGTRSHLRRPSSCGFLRLAGLLAPVTPGFRHGQASFSRGRFYLLLDLGIGISRHIILNMVLKLWCVAKTF
jgi:hypothetical protein